MGWLDDTHWLKYRSRQDNIDAKQNKDIKQLQRAVLNQIASGKKPPMRSTKLQRTQKKQKVMHPSVLTRLNPFLSDCNGARSPDDFGYPTGTAVLKAAVGNTTTAQGQDARGFLPYVSRFQYVPGSLVSGTVNWNAGTVSALPQAAALANLADAYRTVGWGLRITTDSSLTAASGHVWIAHVPISLDVNNPFSNWPNNEAQFAQLPLAEKFSLVELAERPLIVPGRAFDDGIYRFRSNASSSEGASTTNALESTIGWDAIVIFVTGAAVSSSVLNIEFIQHIEYLHDSSTLYGFLDVIPGLYDEPAMKQCSMVATSCPVGLIEETIDTVAKAVQAGMHFFSTASGAVNAVSLAARTAGRLMAGRGWMNSPATSPFGNFRGL